MTAATLTIELPEALLDEIADRAARLAVLQLADEEPSGRDDGYLAPANAAAYLGVSRKRIYDLTSARVLQPDGRDGRTPLYTRETLDRYVAQGLGRR